MAFREAQVSQFTAPTTCYTGCRNKDGFFATETHSFHCSCTVQETKVTGEVLHALAPAPREQKCVGHDHRDGLPWKLFAFLDYSKFQDQASSATQETSGAESAIDETTRPISQSSTVSTSTTGMAKSAVGAEGVLDSSAQSGQSAQDDRPVVAWLVLQCSETERRGTSTFTASLSFRPLAPLLTSPPIQLDDMDDDNGDDGNENYRHHETSVLALLGSADDSKLRCYIADSEHSRHELVPVELEDDAFSFDSPVMVTDSILTADNSQLISVGCQDGTVRVISFRQYHRAGNTLTFKNLVAHTILVDGPIMALHLSQQEHDATHLVVGSMCGFVCRLAKNNERNSSWEGPRMVAEGLWNTKLDSEDAVLAVHLLSKGMIAVGTQSGHCYVWQQREGKANDDSYRLLWDCQLPYSIHGLSHVNVLSSGEPSLLMTTRFTIHVFEREVPKYCAETAKRRLMEMMAHRESNNEKPKTEESLINAID